MPGRAIAIGKFDALHLGHRALAERAAALGAPTLLGFAGMAGVLGWPARQPLVAASDRARVLGAWSARLGQPITAIELPFAEVRPLTPREFVVLARDRCAAAALVVGDDFRFGRDRSGDAAALCALGSELGLAVAVVPAVVLGGTAISSSRVRAAVERGDCAEAAACLGRPYRLVGAVVRGDGRGRSIGVPTANLGALENQAPAGGVYAARAWLGGRSWPAAVNAGHVPTLAGARPFTVEAHLVGFAGDCYGARLELDLVARLRDERRFAGVDELVAQIRRDIAAAVAAVPPAPSAG
ncbi:MAG TPA: riboflavin kinase [Planctomycetota bacterium]|nr:riboflavin kinase [Planctomycetota bacterium]